MYECQWEKITVWNENDNCAHPLRKSAVNRIRMKVGSVVIPMDFTRIPPVPCPVSLRAGFSYFGRKRSCEKIAQRHCPNIVPIFAPAHICAPANECSQFLFQWLCGFSTLVSPLYLYIRSSNRCVMRCNFDVSSRHGSDADECAQGVICYSIPLSFFPP